jgi:hypothetical protein
MRTPIYLLVSIAIPGIAVPGDARAAGSAYQVDTSEVADGGGTCKVESWASAASNSDVIAAANPSCAFNLFKPTELSVQILSQRSDDEWSTTLTPKAKVRLVPSGIGSFGLAVTSTAAFDAATGQNTALTFTIPATMRLSENTRINLNGGWLWDRVADRHYLTYGIGFDMRTPDNVWTLTLEMFGQVGSADAFSTVQPRAQAGIRYRPIDAFSVDLIYGRNITGENANWLTLATVYRFGGR